MKSKYLNQATLLEHLKRGQEEAFVHLIDIYHKRLFGYAISLTNDKEMAEDIVQNVFLRTWEKRKKLEINTSLQNYLFKSTHNEFLNQYKKNRSTMLLEHKYFEALNKSATAHDENSLKHALEIIYGEIEQLPPKCKQVFLLSRKEGLTNTEISDYLNISIKTVEAHITKAFSTLREKFDGNIELILFFLFGTDLKKGRLVD
ncbi:RNA polymerase sigma factor [Flagellimonas oceanensis]|uniref:RNA polymerase sigma factor n=1 Tax=Flagellimonas oceanensis TaxID=2499163 RepID=UPI000F8F49B6|nr:RNA polymerase sigma-70 factor [Allomuricauda oceanensis]